MSCICRLHSNIKFFLMYYNIDILIIPFVDVLGSHTICLYVIILIIHCHGHYPNNVTKEVKDLKDENKKRDIEHCLLHLGSLHK